MKSLRFDFKNSAEDESHYHGIRQNQVDGFYSEHQGYSKLTLDSLFLIHDTAAFIICSSHCDAWDAPVSQSHKVVWSASQLRYLGERYVLDGVYKS